jgi:hypothetical protein
MFGVIDQFEYKHLHEWLKWSISLLKHVEGANKEPINFTRKKEHEALKEAIANTDVKETTEINPIKKHM